MDMSDIEIIEPETPIQKFYCNMNVFITGGTSFLGRILIEKLLRSCPGIINIYILVRQNQRKKTKSIIKNLFRDVIFDTVKENNPNITAKVVAITGDCTLPDLGLSENDKNLLIENANIVFHTAATTRYSETLKSAVRTNVTGTHEVLKLCEAMKNLKSVVYMSSIYAQCQNNIIFERFYQSPTQAKKAMSLAGNMTDCLMEEITTKLLEKHPNTYTFTKAVAEGLVQEFGKVLPIAVIRPSLVVSTYKEPLKGYTNMFYGLTGIMVAVSCGLLSSLHCNSQNAANIVPADMCVNAMIAISVDAARVFYSRTDDTNIQVPIYHFESSHDQRITWGDYVSKTIKNGLKWPPMQSIWYHSVSLQKYYICHYLKLICFNFLPGLFKDFIMITFGQMPWFTKTSRMLLKMTSDMSYFTTHDFTLISKRMHSLIDRMTPEDQKLFFCDLRKLYWDEYFESYFLGMRIYILKDPIETIRAARIKMKKLHAISKIFNLVLLLIFSFFVYYFLSF